MKMPHFLVPHRLNVSGQENLRPAALYMPNRLTLASGKALHKLLDGNVCYLVDKTFPPAEEIMSFLEKKGVEIAYFDFRHTTSRLVRDQILDRLSSGKSVVFLPGVAAKVRGCLADVPAPFLMTLGSLHISPVPVFVAMYNERLYGLYSDEAEPDSREEMCILPRLAPGPCAGERLFAAWMEAGADIYARHPMLAGSLTSMLVRSMRANGAVEIIDGMTGESLTFTKALGVAMSLVPDLQKLGQRRLGIILPPGAGATIATLACLLAGVTPVYINYATSGASFESATRQAELQLFVTAKRFREKLESFPWPEPEKLIFVESLLEGLDKSALVANVLLAKTGPAALICKRFNTDSRRNNDEAAILFTSGSGGDPKGVVLTHRMMIANAGQCCSRATLEGEQCFLAGLPVFHSFGLTVTMFIPLLLGIPFVAYPNPTDARTLNKLIEKYRVTLVCTTPTFARAMLRRAEPGTYRSVHYFIVGAEKLPEDLAREYQERCGVRLLEGYGLTEATPVCGFNLPDAAPVEGSAFYVPGMVEGSVGAVFPGIAVRITDVEDDGAVLPLTERGMIWLKGSNIFSGYLGQDDRLGEHFRDGWFKTGDVGRMDLNGFLMLGGRLSRFSKIGGEMVPHEGVEQALAKVFALDPAAEDGPQIAVTGVSDKQKGEALVLLSSLPQHQRTSQELQNLCTIRAGLMAQQMPTLWVPKYIIPVEAIPTLPTGKLDLRACRMLAEEAISENDEPAEEP